MKHFKHFLLVVLVALMSSMTARAFDFEVDGIYYNVLSEENLTCQVTSYYYGGSYSGAISIPSSVEYNGKTYSVTSIKESAFFDNEGLTSVKIPKSVTEIGNYAFYKCPNLGSFSGKFASNDQRALVVSGEMKSFAPAGLTSYSIPSSVTSIGSGVFRECTVLTSIEIPNSVTLIKNDAFWECTNLKSVEIGNSITSIERDVFYGCSNLESFTGELSSEDHRCIIINGKLSAFAPAGLTSYVIPNSVKSIGDYAFHDCINLTSLEIPSSVTSIEFNALYGCYKLKEIISLNITPPSVQTYGLDGIYKSKCVLKVPAEAIEKYKNAFGWRDFSNIIAIASKITLDDGTDYTNTTDCLCDITYTRTFSHDGWQALFLPFDMKYDDWKEFGEVAELTGASEGNLVWTTLDAGDKTYAGSAYIFKPKSSIVGKPVSFAISDGYLYSNTYIYEETYGGYTLSGTYTTKTDMYDAGAYALAGGEFKKADSASKTLKPYRIFLTTPSPSTAPISNTIIGEGGTVIERVEIDGFTTGEAINLNGQKVGADYRGIVIENGKKVLRK